MSRVSTLLAVLVIGFLPAAASAQRYTYRSCPPGTTCPYAAQATTAAPAPTVQYVYPAPAPAPAPAVRYVYPQPAPQPAVRYYSTTTTTTTVTSGLAEINAYRARYGLPPIAYDANCDSLASANNAQQSRRGLGHFVGGIQCAAVGTAHAAGAVAMWIASAPHRAILLSRSITRGAVRVDNGCATFQAR